MNYPAIMEAIELIRYRPEVPPDKRSTSILLPKGFHLLDIPIGTEVYLLDGED